MASSARPGGSQTLPARPPARLRLRVFDLGGSGLKSALFESSNLAGSSTLVQLEPSLVLGYCPRNAHPRDWLGALHPPVRPSAFQHHTQKRQANIHKTLQLLLLSLYLVENQY